MYYVFYVRDALFTWMRLHLYLSFIVTFPLFIFWNPIHNSQALLMWLKQMIIFSSIFLSLKIYFRICEIFLSNTLCIETLYLDKCNDICYIIPLWTCTIFKWNLEFYPVNLHGAHLLILAIFSTWVDFLDFETNWMDCIGNFVFEIAEYIIRHIISTE